MSTELDLDDCAAQSTKAAAELAKLRTELEILREQKARRVYVTSAEADFDKMTWTFRINQNTRVGAGTYALTWVAPTSAE